MALACMVLACAALLGLSGCGSAIDREEARLCRLAAVALADPDAVTVRAQAPLGADAAGRRGVEVDLTRGSGDGVHTQTAFRVTCRFAGDDLDAVLLDGSLVPEPALFVLKRFWLARPEAAAADPFDADEALPRLPFGLAYPLQQLLAALPKAAIYALLAGSYSLVYGLTGRINLAFGDIAGLGGGAALIGVAAVSAAAFGSAPALLLLLTAAALGLWSSALHGVVIHRLVIWPLRVSSGQQGLVATLGLALALEEYMRLASGNQPRWIGPVLEDPVALARAPGFIVTVTPIALILAGTALGASVGVLALLRFTGFGRAWRASADDPLAAALFGVDPHGLAARSFALASGLAGLAGASATLLYGSVGTAFTTTLGLKALVAAVLGGIGSVPGAFLGGLAIAAVEAGWSAYAPIEYRDLVVEVVLAAALVFRPGGLLGYGDLLPRRV